MPSACFRIVRPSFTNGVRRDRAAHSSHSSSSAGASSGVACPRIVARYSFSSHDATSPDAGPHQASAAPGASATHRRVPLSAFASSLRGQPPLLRTPHLVNRIRRKPFNVKPVEHHPRVRNPRPQRLLPARRQVRRHQLAPRTATRSQLLEEGPQPTSRCRGCARTQVARRRRRARLDRDRFRARPRHRVRPGPESRSSLPASWSAKSHHDWGLLGDR